MNPAFALRSALIPAQPSIRCGIPVEVVQRDRLSDDFVAGWNAAANHFQTPPVPALPRPTEVIFHGPAMGFLHYTPEDMTTDQAEKLLQQTSYFDYVKGRVMKVDLSSDEQFDERLYDRDNGPGAAQSAINSIKTGRS